MAQRKPRRGVALVDDVIARIVRQGGLVDGATPRPLPPARIAALRLPDGRALPPSLARWLAFDAAWIGLFDRRLRARWRVGTLSTLVQRAFGSWGEAFAHEIDPHLPAPGLLLPIGTESCRVLYLGEPDELGEYPVLYVDVDDVPAVGLLAPGFDGYLALAFGSWPTQGTYGQVPKAYEPSMQWHAYRLFDGLRERELGEPDPPKRPSGPATAVVSAPRVDWFDVAAVGTLTLSDAALDGPLVAGSAVFGRTAAQTGRACLTVFERFSAAQRAAGDPYFVDVARDGSALRIHALFDESAFEDLAAPLVRLALTGAGELVLFVMQGPKPVTAYRVRDHQVLEVGREELREIAASPGVHEVYARQKRR